MQLIPCTVCLLLLAALATAKPLSEARDAKIDAFENTINPDGSYAFSYVTSNGISRHETGSVAKAADGGEYTVVRGTYSYTGDDGVLYTVHYVADENGYRLDVPQVAHLPPALLGSLIGRGLR